jgi:hypothetical protein
MSETNRYQAAFPLVENEDTVSYNRGLTKREYFAAMIFSGIAGNSKINNSVDSYAELAVKSADALIAELNK